MRIGIIGAGGNIGNNNAYHSDGSMLMTVDSLEVVGDRSGIFGVSLPPVDESISNEGARALFVAEAIEVLMDYRNVKTRQHIQHP